AISDRVGVMRQGKLVGVEETKNVNEKILASMMVGREVLFDNIEKTGEPGEVKIKADDLYVADNRGLMAVNGVSLEVRAGEVLGIAAIEGNGQSELLEALTGMRPVQKGEFYIMGENGRGKTPGQIRALGAAHIPEDRMTTGVSLQSSITENLIIGKQRQSAFSKYKTHLKQSSIVRYAEKLFEEFDMRGSGVETKVGDLSGGNMQKVVVAREFSFDTPVLIIAQPTRGVDIGAIEFIHKQIIAKRNEGCAILLASADLDEVFRLSDRIITLYEGKITGEFKAGEIDKMGISYYMTGARGESAEEGGADNE
ncbi:MAG: ATP-binding cassette domain-containing protein, partial [Firmicutes bacterium]|nr:ATP-binding cassette domain-containing protein [Bacillota bacterium]